MQKENIKVILLLMFALFSFAVVAFVMCLIENIFYGIFAFCMMTGFFFYVLLNK